MSIELNKIQIANTNRVNSNFQMISYRGTTAPLQNDMVELSTNKKGMSKGVKWFLGIFGSIAAMGIAAKYGYKAYINRAFKKKCSFLQLPENIEFKQANSIEDAIKFAKETLRIKEVDKDFSLDVLNMINKELVHISNLQKGKICMPQALRFKDLGEYTRGHIHSNIRYSTFGEIGINKTLFNNEVLDKQIDRLISLRKKYFMPEGTKLEKPQFETFHQYDIYKPNIDKKFMNLVEKYTKDKNSLSIKEKVDLNLSLYRMDEKITMHAHSPETFYKINKDKLKEFGIDVDIEKYAKMNPGERLKHDMNIYDTLEKNHQFIPIDIEYVPAERIIRHEMGHLQDYAKNYKEIYRSGNELDRWNDDIERIKKKLNAEKTKEYIKKHYPLTCEFIKPENQNIAAEVSTYAKTDIAEFIAETYADLLAGKNFSDEVMALYKKFNGPII